MAVDTAQLNSGSIAGSAKGSHCAATLLPSRPSFARIPLNVTVHSTFVQSHFYFIYTLHLLLICFRWIFFVCLLQVMFNKTWTNLLCRCFNLIFTCSGEEVNLNLIIFCGGHNLYLALLRYIHSCLLELRVLFTATSVRLQIITDLLYKLCIVVS